MSFKIENKLVTVQKDCKKCDHLKVCVFHSDMKKLCNSDKFYRMNKYLEWNNSLKAFEINSSCQYFKLNYIIPDDGSLTLSIDKEIIDRIAKLEKADNVSGWIVDVENNIIEYRYSNSDPVKVKITDLLSKYKFPKK